MKVLYTFISVLLIANHGEGYKLGILVPDMSGSQLMFNQRIAETLADAGHNVTLIRLKMLEYGEVKSKTRKDIQEIIGNGILKDFDYKYLMKKQTEGIFKDMSIWGHLKKENREIISNVSVLFSQSCEAIIRQEGFIDRLKAEKFDVIFSHMYNFCPVGIIEIVKPGSWIWLNSGSLMDYIANIMGLNLPASYAAPIMQDVGDRLTFTDRAKSVLGHTISPLFFKYLSASSETKMFRKVLGEDFPDLIEVSKKCPLVMVSTNELFDLPRPTLNKIVNIGGIGMKPEQAKPLPKDIAEKVQKAESVIVFTFGSVANASMMPEEWKKVFIKAFEAFPKTQFFVRYSTNDLDSVKPKNVEFMKWLPQVDLLHNPKTKALITHGGYNSLQEAINTATPLLAIPLFGDQFKNGRIIEKHDLGFTLMKSQITEEKVISSIKALLEDDKYQKAITRMRKMVHKKPVSPEQNLIKWTEFLAEFKNLDNLKPAGADLDFITFYNIDVYVTFFGIVSGILLVIFLGIRKALRVICRKLGLCKGQEKKAKSD